MTSHIIGAVEQVPRGLEGEGEMEVDSHKVRFERRRERERKRSEKGGKRKDVKLHDREWILKKKEVRCALRSQVDNSNDYSP